VPTGGGAEGRQARTRTGRRRSQGRPRLGGSGAAQLGPGLPHPTVRIVPRTLLPRRPPAPGFRPRGTRDVARETGAVPLARVTPGAPRAPACAPQPPTNLTSGMTEGVIVFPRPGTHDGHA